MVPQKTVLQQETGIFAQARFLSRKMMLHTIKYCKLIPNFLLPENLSLSFLRGALSNDRAGTKVDSYVQHHKV